MQDHVSEYELLEVGFDKIVAKATCNRCAATYLHSFPATEFADYKLTGDTACFKNLETVSLDIRELFFISGLCGPCWNEITVEPVEDTRPGLGWGE